MVNRWTLSNVVTLIPSMVALIFLALLSSQCIAAPSNHTTLSMIASGTDGASIQLGMRTLIFMTIVGIAPACLMAMTAFTRIYIVLAILRQAIGIVNTPSNQIVIGIALFLTVFVMSPVMTKLDAVSIEPLLQEKISLQQAVQNAEQPFRQFMLLQTRDSDMKMFLELAHEKQEIKPEQIPFKVIMASFMTSELKTAFQIGFVVYIPFIIVDLLVSSVLMSMGMIMVSPLAISLPFKILLFTLVNGWGLLFNSLISSFHF